MTKIIFLLRLFVILLIVSSCAHKEIAIKESKLKKEDVLPFIEEQPLYIAHVFRKSATETVDLAASAPYEELKSGLFLLFRQGYVLFYSGSSLTNTTFPVTAKTFSLLTRVPYPTNVTYTWDEIEGTVIFKSVSPPSSLPIPDKMTAKLDPSDLVLYKTRDEAQAAEIKSHIKITVDDIDPKLGAVTYTFVFQPIWYYDQLPDQQNYKRFVLFP